MKPLKFTTTDLCRAAEEWGCNCGPAAFAAVTEKTLDEARVYFGAAGFAKTRFTSKEIMLDALQTAEFDAREVRDGLLPSDGLCRVQWHGPWMLPGVRYAARFRYTHWIGAHFDSLHGATVYDVNWGWVRYDDWREVLAREIMKEVKRCDGRFSLIDRWEVRRRE